MKIYKFKAYSKAKDGVQDRLITRFGLVRNYAVKMMEKYLARKCGKEVRKIDRWYASSQICSNCEHKNPAVKGCEVREWVCPHCGAKHDRDVNAAINILRVGTSTYGLDIVRPTPKGGANVA